MKIVLKTNHMSQESTFRSRQRNITFLIASKSTSELKKVTDSMDGKNCP